ncbi:hypothetical protein [Phytohabitans kaempferiae]|uniref:Uncharacterized protein n=1 Tax=Phytohabitans kaempferiae TaxID=1620943 RepID=A0ABV6M2M0_9ACTN
MCDGQSVSRAADDEWTQLLDLTQLSLYAVLRSENSVLDNALRRQVEAAGQRVDNYAAHATTP